MPFIQVTLSEEEDALIAEAAKVNRRSKREQLAFSAIEHARSILPDFKPATKAAVTTPEVAAKQP